MRRGERSYVLYSQRNEEGGEFEGEAEGVTVWRREGVGALESRWRGAHTYTHTHVHFLSDTRHTHPQRLDSFEEGGARAVHLPMCYVFHLRCGWMEDRAKCFHSRSSRKRHPGRQ